MPVLIFSVGNPPSLAASGLTQSLNLKAAIEYQEGDMDGAREALMLDFM